MDSVGADSDDSVECKSNDGLLETGNENAPITTVNALSTEEKVKEDLIVNSVDGTTKNDIPFEDKNFAEELDGNNISSKPSRWSQQQDPEDPYSRTRSKSCSSKSRNRDEKMKMQLMPLFLNETQSSDVTKTLELPIEGPVRTGRLPKTFKSYRVKKVRSCYKQPSRTKKKRSVYQELKDLAESVRDCEYEKISDEENDENIVFSVIRGVSPGPAVKPKNQEGIEMNMAELNTMIDGLPVAFRKCSMCLVSEVPERSDRLNNMNNCLNRHIKDRIVSGTTGSQVCRWSEPPGFERHLPEQELNTVTDVPIPAIHKRKKESKSSGVNLTKYLDSCVLNSYLINVGPNFGLKREDLVGLIGCRPAEEIIRWDLLNKIVGLE